MIKALDWIYLNLNLSPIVYKHKHANMQFHIRKSKLLRMHEHWFLFLMCRNSKMPQNIIFID